MTTFGQLVARHLNYITGISNELKSELDDLLEDPPDEYDTKKDDYEIAFCGPMGILVWNKNDDNDYCSISVADAEILWNIPVDIENWQREELPPVLLKNCVDERTIFRLILEELNFKYVTSCVGKLGQCGVYISK
jgi:hypothetical protein